MKMLVALNRECQLILKLELRSPVMVNIEILFEVAASDNLVGS